MDSARGVTRDIFRSPLSWLLLALPAVILALFLGWSGGALFLLAGLGIIPLAKLLGDSTEALAAHAGPRVGGLLNATMGNAAELIIAIMAVRAGLLDLVKASITGSILGNLLLIMGGAVLVGGLRRGTQRFDRTHAGLAASQMSLALIALALPTLFAQAIEPDHHAVELLSDSVALIMLITYGLFVLHSLRSAEPRREDVHTGHHWPVRASLVVLVLSTAAIAWLSEIMVGAVEETTALLGLSEFFIGIIIIPIVGNAAEHFVAITAAANDRMELSMTISLSSSMQIALLVAPLLVYGSLLLGPTQLDLVFTPFEIVALFGATLITALIAGDGESNWVEGAQLLAVYLITAMAFFFLPA
ncbi:MAG: calcium/proton exchanger [Anaerolineae bacterium]|nr:calcium/proton exchanger [Anaerolineae bacterium]